ncbi:MAG: SDR family NAD(P)-dependent oxidoreductase [Phycisphaerae bacterium]|jgi:short-subunit dehydrogenase
MNHTGPVGIVTGASSGIGMETAIALARKSYAVVLGARRADKLAEVAGACERAGGTARAIATDVTQRGQVEALVAAAVSEFGRVDVMVNNAGVGLFERVHEMSEADLRAIFEVNFFGLFYGCQAVAPLMMRQRSGHIFNVSSIIGKRGTPFHGAYCATKFAVCGLSDSMRVEMAPYRVRVTTVLPALTETEFFQQSKRGQAAGSSFQKFKGLMPASTVARKIVAAVGKNRPELVISLGGKALVALSAVSPRLIDWAMGMYHADLMKRLKLE